jgi:hypothetical protein
LFQTLFFRNLNKYLGKVKEQESFSKDKISVFTYNLGEPVCHGSQRVLTRERIVHFAVEDVAKAFITFVEPGAAKSLEQNILAILKF